VAKEHFWSFLELFGAPTCGAVFPFGFCKSLFLTTRPITRSLFTSLLVLLIFDDIGLEVATLMLWYLHIGNCMHFCCICFAVVTVPWSFSWVISLYLAISGFGESRSPL
jgi:hypothetical protein